MSLQGAHIYHWHPEHSQHPVLFCSKRAIFKDGKSIRGGIPVCWPWFGPKEGQMQHGFARLSQWQIVEDKSEGSDTHLILSMQSNDETKNFFPYDFALSLEVMAGENLSLSLVTTNQSDVDMPLTQALHTYFQIGDIEDIEIKGLDLSSYLDKTDDYKIKLQEGDVVIRGETDRIYLSDNELILIDKFNNREIVIENFGATNAVIWNPWKDKVKTIYDMEEEEYRNFICIETANADTALTLAPGESYTLDCTISVLI